MRRLFAASPALVLLALGACSSASGDYAITTFDAGDGNFTLANGINDSGEVVGTTYAQGSYVGFVRDPNGGITTFGAPSAVLTYGQGINDSGQIAGEFEATRFAFQGYVRGASGQGYSSFSAPGDSQANMTMALGIDRAGEVVGYLSNFSGSYLRSADGTSFQAITGPGGVDGLAYGISGSGQLIVGVYYDAAGNGRMFVRGASGSSYVTFDAPGAGPVDPFVTGGLAGFGVNDSGQVAGSYFLDTVNYHVQGFVRDADGHVSLLAVPGAVDTYVNGINDQGQLVGSYSDSQGHYHGFIATAVPEPGSLTLLGCGAIAALGYGRRRRRASRV